MAAVVLATRNAHKLREFQRLLPGTPLEPLPDEVELPPETGETFEENALIKAHAAAAATDRPAIADGRLARLPLTQSVAAVSCGMVDGRPLLDLDYSEDSTAEVDANVVMTGDGGLVEVQATAERTPLSRAHLDELLVLAQTGIEGLRAAQEAALAL